MRNFSYTLLAISICLFTTSCSYSQNKPTVPGEQLTVNPIPSKTEYIENGRFVSVSGRFSIAIPEMPVNIGDASSEKAKARGIDTGKSYQWVFPTTRVSFRIFYMPPYDIDGNYAAPSYEDMETGTRKGIFNGKTKLTLEKPIKLGQSAGTEFQGIAPNGARMLTRIYMIGSTGYQILGTYADDAGKKEVFDAIDSFAPIPPN